MDELVMGVMVLLMSIKSLASLTHTKVGKSQTISFKDPEKVLFQLVIGFNKNL